MAAGRSICIAVDMPIGLPDAGRRRADVLARELAGPRRASVFMTPVRSALQEEAHAAATAVNVQLAGEGTLALQGLVRAPDEDPPG